MSDDGQVTSISVGDSISVGETVALAAGAELYAPPLRLRGGSRGKTHSIVGPDAFRSSPSREDVPRLLEQLSQIEEQMERLGGDPLAMEKPPESAFERASSREFARRNLSTEAAASLPEDVARRTGCVCLFFSGDIAFVAASRVSVSKLRTIMQALQRPVNPHLVEESVLEELLDEVYGD